MDVSDLWLDLWWRYRGSWSWYCARHNVAWPASQLGMPRMWRPQGRFRNGANM